MANFAGDETNIAWRLVEASCESAAMMFAAELGGEIVTIGDLECEAN